MQSLQEYKMNLFIFGMLFPSKKMKYFLDLRLKKKKITLHVLASQSVKLFLYLLSYLIPEIYYGIKN